MFWFEKLYINYAGRSSLIVVSEKGELWSLNMKVTEFILTMRMAI